MNSLPQIVHEPVIFETCENLVTEPYKRDERKWLEKKQDQNLKPSLPVLHLLLVVALRKILRASFGEDKDALREQDNLDHHHNLVNRDEPLISAVPFRAKHPGFGVVICGLAVPLNSLHQ